MAIASKIINFDRSLMPVSAGFFVPVVWQVLRLFVGIYFEMGQNWENFLSDIKKGLR